METVKARPKDLVRRASVSRIIHFSYFPLDAKQKKNKKNKKQKKKQQRKKKINNNKKKNRKQNKIK